MKPLISIGFGCVLRVQEAAGRSFNMNSSMELWRLGPEEIMSVEGPKWVHRAREVESCRSGQKKEGNTAGKWPENVGNVAGSVGPADLSGKRVDPAGG